MLEEHGRLDAAADHVARNRSAELLNLIARDVIAGFENFDLTHQLAIEEEVTGANEPPQIESLNDVRHVDHRPDGVMGQSGIDRQPVNITVEHQLFTGNDRLPLKGS